MRSMSRFDFWVSANDEQRLRHLELWLVYRKLMNLSDSMFKDLWGYYDDQGNKSTRSVRTGRM